MLSWAFRHRHRLQLLYGLTEPAGLCGSRIHKMPRASARQGTTAHRARYVVIHPMAPRARRLRAG